MAPSFLIVGAASLVATSNAAALVATSKAQMMVPFESFVELHRRTYQQESTEYKDRKALYERRVADAELHNSHPDRLWTAGVNKLWDWNESELQTLRGWDGSMKPDGGGSRTVRKHGTFLQQSDLPKEKIWGDLYMAKHVKNQGDCGSCWAIAAATVLEGHAEIFSGKPRTFSAQQIVMCTPNPRHCGGDGGCKGATAELAMDWVLKHGSAEDFQVPYTGRDGQCPETGRNAALEMAQLFTGAAPGASTFGMTGWETLPKNEYEPLARALAERGPVAVSVAADTWFSYESGVFNGCGKDAVIDHAVTAIGYGEEAGHK